MSEKTPQEQAVIDAAEREVDEWGHTRPGVETQRALCAAVDTLRASRQRFVVEWGRSAVLRDSGNAYAGCVTGTDTACRHFADLLNRYVPQDGGK
jgi:hypothetical protein